MKIGRGLLSWADLRGGARPVTREKVKGRPVAVVGPPLPLGKSGAPEKTLPSANLSLLTVLPVRAEYKKRGDIAAPHSHRGER
jgi:hypothetical protein